MNRIQRVRRFRLASLALSLVALLAVSSIPAASPALAAGTATVRIDPAPVSVPGPGSSFTVTVRSNASLDSSGIQASLTFDRALLQITSVARPATDWGTAGIFFGTTGDLTNAANMAAAIAAANGTGRLATIAANMTPPAVRPAAVDQTFLLVTFQVIACPVGPATTTPLGLPVGPADVVVLDATGDPAAVTTTGAVVTPCVANSGNPLTKVTSTLDAGFLGLAVNPNISIPLIRQVENSVDVPVEVFSDGTWSLKVQDEMPGSRWVPLAAENTSVTLPPGTWPVRFGSGTTFVQQNLSGTFACSIATFGTDPTPGIVKRCDYQVSPKLPANRGHMTDAPGLKRLAQPMSAQVEALPRRSLNADPIGDLMSGDGIQTPVVTLRQFVGPSDPPASYTIGLIFTATSGF